MASVFNQVKIYIGQSVVSELSLRGCVKLNSISTQGSELSHASELSHRGA